MNIFESFFYTYNDKELIMTLKLVGQQRAKM